MKLLEEEKNELKIRIESMVSKLAAAEALAEERERDARLARAERDKTASFYDANFKKMEEELRLRDAKFLSLRAENETALFRKETESGDLKSELELTRVRLRAAEETTKVALERARAANEELEYQRSMRVESEQKLIEAEKKNESGFARENVELAQLKRERSEMSTRYESIIERIKREAVDRNEENENEKKNLRGRLASLGVELESARGEIRSLTRRLQSVERAEEEEGANESTAARKEKML